MGYLEAYVVRENELAENRMFAYSLADPGAVGILNHWVSRILRDARQEKTSVRVYVIEHTHAMSGTECECADYAEPIPYAEYMPDEEE